MSTDYDWCCSKCKVYGHIGQRFAGSTGLVFGFGTDDNKGRKEIGDELLKHLEECLSNEADGTTNIFIAEFPPKDYKRWDADDWTP